MEAMLPYLAAMHPMQPDHVHDGAAELAAAHGGTAQAASQPGCGTTFTIRLPAASHTAAQPLPHGIFTAAP